MQGAGSLVSLLVLGAAWTLQTVPALPEPVVPTQENFDLNKFMGRWYEVAVVSTCPHYMKRKRGNPVIVALELQHVASKSNFSVASASFSNGTCKHTSTDYSLTSTPGRFFYHFARFRADVDVFVVQTNYDEFAMMLLLGTEEPSGNTTTTVKLHSRAMNVTAAVLDDFRSLSLVKPLVLAQVKDAGNIRPEPQMVWTDQHTTLGCHVVSALMHVCKACFLQ